MNTRPVISGTITIIMMMLVFALSSMTVSGQGQANAGPDTTVCKDVPVTLGGAMDPSWCFHWTPHEGLSDPYVANPQATPAATTTYTLTVTGQNFSFTSTDQVTVSVIVISDITFNPNPLLNSMAQTSQASATINAGGPLIWSIEGDAIGCTINSSTGLINAGITTGQITVRAKSTAYPDCYQEADLCIGSGDDCCPVYENFTKTFGPITVTIPGKIEPTMPLDGGYCRYSCTTAVNISMEGVFQKNYSLPGVTVSWKEKPGDPTDFKDVTLTWQGTFTAGTFGLIDANITEVSLGVNSSGDLTGSITFGVFMNQDKPIGQIAVLRSGLNGTFTYTYTSGGGGGSLLNGAGFGGDWNFNGIKGFHVDLMKGTTVIATVTVGTFDANGNIIDAELVAAGTPSWTTHNFTLTLEELSLKFDYSIPNNQVDFKAGTGKISLKNITNVEGDIELGLVFTSTNVTASVTLSNAKAFSCTVGGTLTCDFNYQFELQSIAGSDISAKHDDFDQSFTNVEFEIKDGALEKFGIGQLEVKYKNKITFSMTDALYEKASGELSFNAKVTLPGIELDVTDFKINNTGFVTVGNIGADINESPVSLQINIGWSTDQFQGNFAGSFTGGVSINGSIIIGATATFNYGHFSLGVSTPGIPLGQSGLKIKSLAGEFGYNWKAPDTIGVSGIPEQGTKTIGFGLGISDLANVVLVEGYIRLTLGAATQIYLRGNVKITANPPHYFNGQLELWYTLGSTSVNGAISSEINFPAASGDVIKFNTGNVVFSVGNGKWTCQGTAMAGKIFTQIDVTASVNAWAWLASPGSITGTLTGNMNWDYNLSFAYPTGFDPSSCANADATDNWLGFGVTGSMQINLAGALNANINETGITGNIGVQGSANASLSIKWPCLVCGYNCVDTYNAAIEGALTVQKTSSGARIFGNVKFSYQNEQEYGDIDFNI
ncbi:MAG TPA: hypothetical protein P5338_03160 [Bacteroidales bacterium]|nr:hypothetical protein [Bacteroidales bacterium]